MLLRNNHGRILADNIQREARMMLMMHIMRCVLKASTKVRLHGIYQIRSNTLHVKMTTY